MARRPRLELPGVPLHVIQRGNNRASCFHADGDRRLYLRCLNGAAARHGCAVHAYVLMPNHVHLLVTPTTVGAVASMMQDLGRRYVRLFNTIHERSGTLWEGRYKSSLIDTEAYLLTCHRYIELNPVRAGLVQHPLQYPWSSCSHYALGTTNPLITRHPLFDEIARQQGAFPTEYGNEMSPEVIRRIRVAANKGWPLGSDSFLNRIGALLGRSARPPKRGRPFKRKDEANRQESEMLI
jgi:putative transposase